LFNERHLHLGAIVLNKVLPKYLLDQDATRVAQRFCGDASKIASQLPRDDAAQVAKLGATGVPVAPGPPEGRRHRPRPVGARNLGGDARVVAQRFQRHGERGFIVHAGGDEVGVMLRHVLRELIDDVVGPRRVERQR